MINCFKQPSSTVTLTNARCIRREYDAGIGIVEEWVYDSGSAAGAMASNVYHGGVPFVVANDGTSDFCDSTFTGFIMISNNEDVSAIFALKGATGATLEVSDPDGHYSVTQGTASSTNVYWNAGTSRYRLENKRGAEVTYSIFRIGTPI
jgi:hypothetical protein